MDRLEIETAYGPIWLRGTDTGQPVLLVVHGAFAELEAIGKFQIRGLDTFQAHLPGNHCPEHEVTTVEAWGAAFREVIEKAFPGRLIIGLGVSTGALALLAARSPDIRRFIFIEPPLRPSLAWPLRLLREQAPAWGAELVWQVFGVGPDRFESRDYSHLLHDLRAPATVLIGNIPLDPPRKLTVMPTLIDPQTRAELDAHPRVELRIAEGVGHNIPRDARELLLSAILDARAAEIPAFRPGGPSA